MAGVHIRDLPISPSWTGFFVWALVAASTAFWGFKIFATTRPAPPGVVAQQVASGFGGPMDRLFGAVVVPPIPVNTPPPESSRFQLMGVIAASGNVERGGMAIVSVDGQAARAWHVGAALDANTSLLAVARRTAFFGPVGGPMAFTLQLPDPPAAATGTLPAAVSGATRAAGDQPGGERGTVGPGYLTPSTAAVPGRAPDAVGS